MRAFRLAKRAENIEKGSKKRKELLNHSYKFSKTFHQFEKRNQPGTIRREKYNQTNVQWKILKLETSKIQRNHLENIEKGSKNNAKIYWMNLKTAQVAVRRNNTEASD